MWSPNARDVGGLPTRYGVPTRARALLRSECIDAAGLPEFETVAAGLVLDLRSDWELKQPHPLAGDSVYQRIPWIDPAAEATRDPAAEPRLVDVYRNSLARNAAHVGRIFTAIAEAPADRPVVVHCKAGKDRTGLTVAILLDLVGVPRPDIAADYAISETNLGLQDAPAFSRSHPDTILGSLSYLDERFGGVRGYLAWLGLSETQIHRLATRLVPTDVQAVVFDFDGLLMDTETTMVESWQTEWAYHGLELDLDGFWPGHGGDVSDDRYAVLAAAVGAGFDRAESHARRLAHRDRMHAELDFRPGIRAWISSAHELGLRVAIASSSPGAGSSVTSSGSTRSNSSTRSSPATRWTPTSPTRPSTSSRSSGSAYPRSPSRTHPTASQQPRRQACSQSPSPTRTSPRTRSPPPTSS